MPNSSRKDLEREHKILLARRKIEGGLASQDKQRLAWLAARLGAGGVPDLSEDSTDPTGTATLDELQTRIDSDAMPDPHRPLAASDLFTDSTVGRERTATGAKPIDLEALDRRSRASSGAPNDLSGPRRALVQLTGGVTRRGMLLEPKVDAERITLEPGGAGDDGLQTIEAGRIETIRLMLPDGLAPAKKRGRAIRVALKDGKRLAGYSPDYTPDREAFTLLPAGEKFIERIYVYRRVVAQVTFDEQNG